MAIMPGALWRPLPGSSTFRITQYDILCFHTMVGSLWGTDAYFRRASGVNSHFGVGHDGTIIQWVDTAYRSGANLNGNWHIISVETADVGTGFPAWNMNDASQVPAWTEAQLVALAKIAAWVHETHGIPLSLIPDSKVGRRGIGYHRQGVPGYLVAGGEQWSNAYGKVCPGSRRIAQIPEVIARVGNDMEDIMATLEELRKAIREEVPRALFSPSPELEIGGKESRTLNSMVGRLLDDASSARGNSSQTVALLKSNPAPEVDEGALVEAFKPVLAEMVANIDGVSPEEFVNEFVERLAARPV